MATTYPGTLDVFTNPVGTNTLDSPDHALQHSDANDSIEAIQAVLGTTAGTSVLMGFSAGQFAAKTAGGTINTSTFGTPTFTLGSDATGDMFFRSAGGTATRLGIGSSGQYLTTNGTSPSWGTVASSSSDGWTLDSNTWTVAGTASDPQFTITSPGTINTTFGQGARFKMDNAGSTGYYLLSLAPAVASGTTTLTLYGGTAYNLVSGSAITNVYYSREKAPLNFPLADSFWTVQRVDTSSRTQASPTQNQWYNLGGTATQVSIPAGLWKASYKVFANPYKANTDSIAQHVTFSTGTASESDADFTAQIELSNGSVATSVGGLSLYVEKNLSLATVTPYYLNSKTKNASMNNITFANDQVKMIINAKSNLI